MILSVRVHHTGAYPLGRLVALVFVPEPLVDLVGRHACFCADSSAAFYRVVMVFTPPPLQDVQLILRFASVSALAALQVFLS